MKKTNPLLRAYPLYHWSVYMPFLALSTAAYGTAASVAAVAAGPRQASEIGARWARANAAVARLKVDVLGAENVDPTCSYVVVANHQSQFDIFVLYGSLPVDFRWVMKAELRHVPFLGYACEKVGHVFIDRSTPHLAAASIAAAARRLRDGTSILFFPEGTRSPDGQLLPFKKGAFHLALDLGLPVLPVTIVGTRDLLPKGTLNARPGRVQMIIGEPIPVDGYERDEVDKLSGAARTVIESTYASHKR